jgi:ketosteroid isomerase-like protein
MSHILDRARRYLKAVEDGDAAYVASVFSADGVIEQLPNRIYPNGLRADVSQVAAAFERGRKIFARQTYEIISESVVGDRVALEILWTATLAVAFGTLAAWDQMRCHSAMFLEFRDGQIATQRNYDCFEPW